MFCQTSTSGDSLMVNMEKRKPRAQDNLGEVDERPVELPRETVKPTVLLLLRGRKAHGYALLEELEALGVPVREPGGFYRVLRKLEGSDLIRSRWEPPASGPARRVYQLTAKGERELAVLADALERQHQLMSSHVRRFQKAASESPPLADAADTDTDPA